MIQQYFVYDGYVNAVRLTVSTVPDESLETSSGQHGDPCLSDDDCDEDEDFVCDVETSRCVCADGYILNVDALTCGMSIPSPFFLNSHSFICSCRL